MKIKTAIALLFGIALFTSQAQAQRATPDQYKTNKGPLIVQPVLHGTLMLQWNNQTIYVDPYGGAEAFAGLAAPDLILITDIHGDHLDLKTLAAINTSKATFVVPQAVADQLPAAYKERVVVLKNGEKTERAGMTLTAIPMYNLPAEAETRHPKGRGNGYLLAMGGQTVYISGDTEDIPEMRALKNIDVAFVCMNLPYTMGVEQAAQGVLAFAPKVVYPYHFRGQGGLADVEAFKKAVNTENKKIDVRLRNWYPQQ